MCVTARSRVNDEQTPPSLPREARTILKGHSDNEAVQSSFFFFLHTFTLQLLDKPWSQVSSPVLAFNFYRA